MFSGRGVDIRFQEVSSAYFMLFSFYVLYVSPGKGNVKKNHHKRIWELFLNKICSDQIVINMKACTNKRLYLGTTCDYQYELLTNYSRENISLF